MSDDDELPLAVALEAADAPPPANKRENGGDVAQPQQPVPVTLITGYLGAGKTTLVRHVLEGAHGRRIAVILNEFGGEPGLEAAFVQDAAGDRADVPQWVELANGCLCCSVKGEFVQALEGLLASDSRHAGRFDYVLVETTGLANPGPIMASLWTDEELEAAVELDGVVTLVDARNVGAQLAEARRGGAANEAQLQVGLADVVLLNKMDLVSEEQAAAVERQLRAINSAAAILRATRSAVDLGQLLDRGAYRMRLLEQQQQQQQSDAGATLPKAALSPLEWLGEPAACGAGVGCSVPGCSDPAHAHGRGQQHQHQHQQPAPCEAHDQAVRTVSLRPQRPLVLERFKAWVEGLLWEQPQQQPAAAPHAGAAAGPGPSEQDAAAGQAPEAGAAGGAPGEDEAGPPQLLRMKGLLDVDGSEAVHLFQAVADTYDVAPGPGWPAFLAQQQRRQEQQQQQQGGDALPGRMSRLVLIGRRLDPAALAAQLEACCVGEAEGVPSGG